MKVREAAFVSLQKFENAGKYLNIEADTAIRRNGFEGADRGLYTSIFYGTVEHGITIDYLLGKLCHRPLGEIDANVRIILRMSVYQLRYLDRVPAYAVLNDAGELTRRFASKDAVPFVNGVLRAYVREGAGIVLPTYEEDPIAYLSVRASVPAWLCRMWCDAYGFARADRILAAMEQNPPITLFVNTTRTTRAALAERLRAVGIGCEPTLYSAYGLRLTAHVPLEKLTVLDEGLCFVQDEASQLCATALAVKPGMRVLDACACPGGKSFALAVMMENRGHIDSCDLHENKLSLITRGAEKNGLSCVHPTVRDASVPDPAREGTYDRVLCDVPCSGLGVLAKKPDIRLKRQEDIERLPQIQASILANTARSTAPGGLLVYSTCTLNPAENEQQAARFLQENPQFEPADIPVGPRLFHGTATLLPDEMQGCDGFFIAAFRRKEQ